MAKKKKLTPAERLIVAADFKPQRSSSNSGSLLAQIYMMGLCNHLRGTGVYIKVNSALRAVGYPLIDIIHDNGLKCFADLKLYDISETLATDGELLFDKKPELLTTVCSCGSKAISALKKVLPETEVLGVTVLTSLTEEDSMMIHGVSISRAVLSMAKIGLESSLDGFISSPAEADMLRRLVGENKTINTPGIRPTWAIVKGDDQNPDRIMTPAKAIKAGADRIVVGRPIVQAGNPLDAVKRTIDEIAQALEM